MTILKTACVSALCGAALLLPSNLRAADAPAKAGDAVLAKGTNFEVRQSDLDKVYHQTEAGAKASGQTIPPDQRPGLEAKLLDQLVITKILLGKATDADRKKGQEAYESSLADAKVRAGGEEAFKKQITDAGASVEELQARILEQAICGEVLMREAKSSIKIGDEQARKFYDDNPRQFEQPESVRAAHILIATQDITTQKELSDAEKKERKKKIDALLVRARKGEDFGKLAKEFSDDPGSKDRGGEYNFPRGQMVPAFENAAFALKPNEISDVVTTEFGYHIIKLIAKVAPEKTPYEKVAEKLKDYLLQTEFKNRQGEIFDRLKFDAGVKLTTPPPAAAPAAPVKKP